MKPKYIAGFLFGLLLTATPSFGLHTNVIKFYLHPDLVTNISFVRTNLAKYVGDMNYILAKNTGRFLSYNTNTGVILTNQPPHDQTEVAGGNPTNGYEIWAHAVRTTQPISHDGYMSVDSTTGAGVLGGMNWTRIYNPDLITDGGTNFIDYRTQIETMLHEFGHVFGAATSTGEYYQLGVIDDTTGVPPLVNIRALSNPFTGAFNYSDIFWGIHSDFAMDPLLRPPPATNRAGILSLTLFSDLSATIMAQNYRYSFFTPPPMTSITGLRLLVTDDLTCLPLEGVTVKIWRISGNPNISLALLVNTVTGTNGEVIWNWNPQTQFIDGDPLRLIKISRTGYETNAFYVSAIDLQQMRILEGHTTATNRLAMTRPRLKLSTTSKGVIRVTNTVPNKTFKIEASTNFVNWVVLVTNTPTTQAVLIYTNATTLPHRFYRTVEAALDGCNPEMEMMMMQPPPEEFIQESEPAQPSKKNTELPPLPTYIKLKL